VIDTDIAAAAAAAAAAVVVVVVVVVNVPYVDHYMSVDSYM
jgi:hypothetical protein